MVTKEEKKAKKEAKRLEKLRQEAEARKKAKRDELQREIANQALKRKEIETNWRETMLKIKEPFFRKDIEILWHTFERAYDKKDHLIAYTIKLMNTADDQFQRTVSSFCDTIDTMINKFLIDLDNLSKENDRRTAHLLKSGEDEVASVMFDHNAAETHLQLLLFHGHTTADNLAWNTRGENLVKEDEERLKYANDRENLRSYLENNYSVMWDNYKAVLKAYVLDTADNQKQVRKLRRKENLMADIIASQGKKIANSGGILKRLRTELQSYESGTKQAVFRDRRNRHRAACFKLKQRLVNGRETDTKKLSLLVKESDNAVEWLAAAHKKAETILKLAALCRKFETQQEKVLPFGYDMPHEPSQAKSIRRQQSDDSLVVNAISSTCGLTRLWHRIAKAELTKKALQREKLLLEHENDLLTMRLEESESNHRNLTTNLTTNLCICGSNSKVSNSHPTAVEGILEIHKYGGNFF